MTICGPGLDVEGNRASVSARPSQEPLDWDAAFRDCVPAVRAFVRTRVPAACLDDVVQDTFERAYRSRHRFDPTRPLWPWLVTIAKRACAEVQRGGRVEPLIDLRADDVVARDDPHREFERRQQAVAITRTLAGLTPRHRRLLVGWEIEGRRFDDLAAMEGLSRQALKSVLCRARHGFRVGYASLAKGSGLAVFALGRLLARVRDRLQAGVPAAELMLGGVVLGATAAVLLVNVPPAQSGAPGRQLEAVGASSIGPLSGPDVPAPPPPRRAGDQGSGGNAVGPPLSGRPAPEPSPRTPVGARADGGAAVKITPTGPKVTFSVTWENDQVRGRARATVTVDCLGGALDPACEALQAVPGGRP